MQKNREGSKRDYSVAAIDKMMKILNYLQKNGKVAFTDIYTDLDLPKSSTYQLLQGMCKHNLVQMKDNNCYYLGIKLFELGYTMGMSIDIKNVAEPHLKEIAAKTQLTAMLGILNSNYQGIFVGKVDAENQDYTFHHMNIGSLIRLHQSAAGKALVAWQPADDLPHIVDQIDFSGGTEHTIKSKEEYLEELSKIRTAGYAVDDRETTPYVKGVGVPVWDWEGKVVGAISLGGLAEDVDKIGIQELANTLRWAAQQISREMGA